MFIRVCLLVTLGSIFKLKSVFEKEKKGCLTKFRKYF